MASDQISFLHSTGGLLSEAILSELRKDRPTGPAGKLDDPGTFLAIDGSAPTRAVHEEDLELGFKTTEATWSVLADSLDDLETSRVRDRLLLPLFRLLGFEPQFQKAHLAAGCERYAISHLGWEGEGAPPLLLVAGDLDERAGKRSPHQELQAYLNATDIRWGIAANAREVRILRDFHHTTVQGAVIIDLADLLEAGSFADFRAMYRLCHASRFMPPPGDGGLLYDQVLIEQVYQDSVSEGVAVGKALQPQVRRALTALLNGILEGDAALRQRLSDDPAFGRELYRELLVMLYRLLFVLFAEQRGLLDGANDVYADSYSVSRLRTLAETRTPEPRRGDLWEGLKATFAAFAGDEEMAAALGVYPYNGHLFDPGNTKYINEATCTNEHLLDAVRALTTVVLGGVRQYVDFRHLGVEELGTVYESLLAYTIRIATEPIDVEGIAIHTGQGYLAPLSLERSELGAYYTPPKLVDLTLSTALDEMINDCLERAMSLAEKEEALLDLRIIDPACGSAAFLVGAIDRVAAALADVRSGDHQPTDRNVAHARRDVLQHCIYGVDVDPFAAELAKVALWIHCAVDDMPLTFLDHKIVCGNSLVGWPMFDLPDEIPDAAYDTPSGLSGKKNAPIREQYRAARDRNREYLSQFDDPSSGTGLALEFAPKPEIDLEFPEELLVDDRTVGDVRRKAEALGRYRSSVAYRRAKLAADLWTAAFFWSPDAGPFPTSKDYHEALSGDLGEFDGPFDALLADVNPLHWPLAFPDIYQRGGFDLVIGNPPWEKFVTPEQEFFAAQGRFDIASMTSAQRKKAIQGLADGDERDRRLYAIWIRHKTANDRMSHFAKSSGRFTPVSGEANTYVLFTEVAAQVTERRGWASIVVKSGIAIDKTPAPVWARLLDSGRVRSVIDMVNHGKAIFSEPSAVERFTVLTLGPVREETAFAASMLSFSLDEAREKDPIILTADDVDVVNPHTRTLLSARTKSEYDLAVSIHKRVPILDLDGDNPWGVQYYRLFDSSGDSNLFLRKEDLEADGWVLGRDKIFRRGDEEALPVLEGQLVNQWDHRAKSYELYTGPNKYGRKPNVPPTTDEQKSDPAFEAEPRYWMLAEVANERISPAVGQEALVAIRDVSRPWTDRRSARATLVPRYPVTHTIPQLVVPLASVCEFLAVYNSTVFDFVARSHMPGGHLAMTWLLSQLAAPEQGLDRRIGERAERLSVTSNRLAEEYSLPVYAWDVAERLADLTFLDALVARSAYELLRNEYEIVLDSFDVLRRAEEAEHGEYRFKRLCLEAYDRL